MLVFPFTCILTGLDDFYGDRTVNAIPNVRGIARFDVGWDHANSSAQMTMTNVGLNDAIEVHRMIRHP